MKNILLIVLAAFVMACTPDKLLVLNTNELATHRINFIETAHSTNADSLYHRFNIIKTRTDNKELIGDIKPDEFEAATSDAPTTVEGIRRLPLSAARFHRALSFRC